MFKNYLLLTLRNISRQNITSLIAILGLSLGITSAVLLYEYIEYHLTYESFMPENHNIKRIVTRRMDEFGGEKFYGTNSLNYHYTNLFEDRVSFIEDMTSIKFEWEIFLSANERMFSENVMFAEENVFEFFPLPFLEGDKESFSSDPQSIILDREMANKLFPDEQALGREIIYKSTSPVTLIVRGIVEIPKNSHLYKEGGQAIIPLDILIDDLRNEYTDSDSNWKPSVYFIPAPNFEKDLFTEEVKQITTSIPDKNQSVVKEIFFEDVERIHLYSKENSSDIGNPIYLIIFLSALTLLLMAISIVNTISILTAQSMNRTREVGIRLVMGSRRKDLILQFLTESVILSLISLIIALIFAELLQPAFSNIVETDLVLNYSPIFLLYIFLVVLLTGIIAGLFPALYLSSLKTTESLKGRNLLKLGRSKKILIIFQFLIASIVLIWSVTINNEMKYIQNLDPGFDSKNLIAIFPGYNLDLEPVEKLRAVKNEIQKLKDVENVSFTSYAPYTGGIGWNNLYISDDEKITKTEVFLNVDKDFFKVLDLPLLEGEIQKNGVVIQKSVNEYRELSIGDLVELDSNEYNICAIIDDFNLGTLLQGESPQFYIITEDIFYFQLIRINENANIKEIEKTWSSIFPNRISEISFITENIKNDNNPPIIQVLKKIINLALFITLLISGLGLFGLTLHMIKQKTKEIGIRKVLGAGFLSIIIQFLKEIASLILIGILIGIPLGVYTIKYVIFLMGYPYPVHDLLKISLGSASALILVGSLLIGIMVSKIARSNPSDSLRYE